MSPAIVLSFALLGGPIAPEVTATPSEEALLILKRTWERRAHEERLGRLACEVAAEEQRKAVAELDGMNAPEKALVYGLHAFAIGILVGVLLVSTRAGL